MQIANLDAILDRSRSRIGSPHIGWENGNYLNVTLCVTEECNLACTYCYMVGKNNYHRMSFPTAKKIVDFLLEDPYCTGLADNLLIDFIGGEPLLEMELVDLITDYICMSMYVKKHKWFNKFQISFSTNGTLYDKPIVSHYLAKHRMHCGFGFSIDGNKEKHDLTRKTRDGHGSYDMVMKGFEKYKQDYGNEIFQKSTFSSPDLKYLKDSIIHLWDLGFTNVESNLVYEDVWKEGDAELFEAQLISLADYMFESGRYLTHSVAYFEKRRGLPLCPSTLNQNRCGAGYKSLAFDCEGNIYPCIRFLDMCDQNKTSKIVGNINTGIEYNALRALCGTTWNAVSSSKCRNCEVGTDCGWCVAHNYQTNGTMYERVTAICEMHKANVRANKYFWRKYEQITGYTSERTIERVLRTQHSFLKYVYFITSDSAPAYCNYNKAISNGLVMSTELYQKGLAFCMDNEVLPIFLGSAPDFIDPRKKVYFEIDSVRKYNVPARSITVVDTFSENVSTPVINLLVRKNCILSLASIVEKYSSSDVKRINLFFPDSHLWTDEDLDLYTRELDSIIDLLVPLYSNGNINFQINVLSDRLGLLDGESRDCAAGRNSVALAPNGKFYICAGFYFTNPEWSIGDIEKGIVQTARERYFREKSPMCSSCKALTCERCLLDNKIHTNEISIPSSTRCRLGYIHANAQSALCNKLHLIMGNRYCFAARDVPRLQYIDYVANMIYKDERSIAQRWMY